MAKGLRIAEPPRRRSEATPEPGRRGQARDEKFSQVAEDEKVQFNRRVSRGVADGYEMLAIRTRRKVPELLAEGLELLEKRYGRV